MEGFQVTRSRLVSEKQKSGQFRSKSHETYRIDLITALGVILCQFVIIAFFLQYCKGNCEHVNQTAKDGFHIKNLESALQRAQQEVQQISAIHEDMMGKCGQTSDDESQIATTSPDSSHNPRERKGGLHMPISEAENYVSEGAIRSVPIQDAEYESAEDSHLSVSQRVASLQLRCAELSQENALLQSRELERLGRLPPSDIFENIRLPPPWTGTSRLQKPLASGGRRLIPR